MKLLVTNQSIPRAARSADSVLVLQRIATKETPQRPEPTANPSLRKLPNNLGDFLQLARLDPPAQTMYANIDEFHSFLSQGDICLIGGLAVAALQAEDLASSFRHPSYPWPRQVDILLIGGTLKKMDLHHLINAAVLPTLVFFSGGGEGSVEQIRKSSNATRIIDLGGEKDRFFEIEYDQSDTLALTQYRPGLLGKKRLDQERFALSKYSRILSFLKERCLESVTQKLDVHLAQQEGDEEGAIGAWLPAEDMMTAAAEYLAHLDRQAGVSEKEREELLQRLFKEKILKIGHPISDTIDAQVRKISEMNMKAFALYLEAWGLREEQEASPPSTPYR